jgi:hypothetical protein
MGQRSFGKGSVQSVVSLGEGKGALRLTTALYHGPSGRTVQRTGVAPDIELFSAEDGAAKTRRREADRERALPGADEPPPPKARIEQSRCAGAAFCSEVTQGLQPRRFGVDFELMLQGWRDNKPSAHRVFSAHVR